MAREHDGIGLVLSPSERRVLFAAYATMNDHGLFTLRAISEYVGWAGPEYVARVAVQLADLGLMERLDVRGPGGSLKNCHRYRVCRPLTVYKDTHKENPAKGGNRCHGRKK